MSTLNQPLASTNNYSKKSYSNFLLRRPINAQEINLVIAFIGFIILVLASILIAVSTNSNNSFVESSSLNIFMGIVMIGSVTLAAKSIMDVEII